MKLSEFDYTLPKELIAQAPAHQRDMSRLMVVKQKIMHRHFADIPEYLNKGDVIVINEAMVARVLLHGRKSTGAPVSIILLERKAEQSSAGYRVWCKIKANRPHEGNVLVFDHGLTGIVAKQSKEDFLICFNHDPFLFKGCLPLPWYAKDAPEESYQTVYCNFAKAESLAAPTAGLHFTQALLEKIRQKQVRIAKVCLHIGFDTFLPIRESNILEHKMHEEEYEIDEENASLINSCLDEGRRLFCVGTTSLRVVESACDNKGCIHAQKAKTRIYIHPGYKFKSGVSGLITNFHLPKTSLFVLVCGFAGIKNIHAAYKEAVDKHYRFYSFGDAMLLYRKK